MSDLTRVEVSTDGLSKTADDAAPENKAGDRPEWLDEKFASGEDMAKAYKELEKKLGAQPPAKAEGEGAPKITQPTADEARAAVEKAGLDMKALSKEYADNDGKLSDATVKTLADKGITKEALDSYVAGQQAQAKLIADEITTVVGGAEQLQTLYSWASANMSAEEIKAFNGAVESGDKALARFAMQGLMARYQNANGKAPSLVNSERAPLAAGAQPFESNAQVVAAIGDPRYQNDEAYRKQVERRLAVTEGLFSIRY